MCVCTRVCAHPCVESKSTGKFLPACPLGILGPCFQKSQIRPGRAQVPHLKVNIWTWPISVSTCLPAFPEPATFQMHCLLNSTCSLQTLLWPEPEIDIYSIPKLLWRSVSWSHLGRDSKSHWASLVNTHICSGQERRSRRKGEIDFS